VCSSDLTPSLIDDAALARITREIVEPTLEGMASEGSPFRGVLYAGLMLTGDGPRIIEYNVRLGDPETQAVIVRLESDLAEIFEALADGRVGDTSMSWSNNSSACVVAASAGYPGEYQQGKPIGGLDEASAMKNVAVFHAGTVRDEQGSVLTSGGRVLGVTAWAETLDSARDRAYEAIGKISFEGLHYRKDIAATEP